MGMCCHHDFLNARDLQSTAIDSSISKQLVDKMYEKRKAAALELEKYLHSPIRHEDAWNKHLDI